KFIVALLAPDRGALESDAKTRGVTYQHWTDLLEDSQIQASFRTAVAEANSQLASWESVKRYAVLPQEFTVEGGELTPSLKVRRKAMEKKFSDLLESLYV
ncbi:MAG TPA: long-chain fatty acid--CoA ligase, partial [Pseudobdellovibrionaceae bacterium]|nr:long-chain fatty acid--CoA ligase [Pseudobdellovibrionaceae bacterium]